MNRDSKYRAWRLDEKRMIDPVIAIHFDIPSIEWYEDMHDALSGNLTDCPMEHTILMQYTGLKDKNGKEIYSDFIISDNLGVGKVEYVEKRAAYRVAYKDGSRKWFVDYTDEELRTIEIIGNIHDNPELFDGSDGA